MQGKKSNIIIKTKANFTKSQKKVLATDRGERERERESTA